MAPAPRVSARGATFRQRAGSAPLRGASNVGSVEKLSALRGAARSKAAENPPMSSKPRPTERPLRTRAGEDVDPLVRRPGGADVRREASR